MDSKVRENLIAARALIDTPEKWGKGEDIAAGRICVMLACSVVAKSNGDSFDGMRAALIDALPTDRRFSVMPTVDFNDHPNTTHADILALFDRAIAACTTEQVA